MDATDLIGLLSIGFAAGVVSGLVGVGGGVLFVPGLVLFMDEVQVEAEATSLFAVIVVAAVGAYRQRGYGNLRLRDGIIVGLLSPVGVAVGVVVANELPERALQIAFAVVQLFFAYRLARRALGGHEEAPARG
jgi:uncharacterized membrane protein YfcA